MDRETEKMFKDLQKHLNDKKPGNDKEYNEAVSEFMSMYNNKVPKKKGPPTMDYLQMAYEADSEKDALKYAKKALQLDENCLDAEIIIAELTINDYEKLKLQYEKLIAKAEAYLKEEDIFNDDNIGHFWGILETRPYMRLRHHYLHLLITQGKFRKAIKECEDLLLLSENDNLGIRYILMSLYAFFEDEINVLKLHLKYEKEASTQMLLPIIALYYKLDNYKKAESYLKKLSAVNRDLREVFSDPESFEDIDMEEVIESGMYRAGSKEEIMISITDSAFLYETSTGLFFWLAERTGRL